MAKVIMRVVGMDGEVDLLTDRIVINRKGLWNAIKFGFNARREIPLGAISEVAFRPARALLFGQIEFVRGGRSVDEKKDAMHNTVHFKGKQNHQFEQLKEKMFEIIEQYARQQRG